MNILVCRLAPVCKRITYQWVIILSAAFVITSCTTFTKDSGLGDVVSYVEARSDYAPVKVESPAKCSDQTRMTQEILASTLSVDDAIRLALLNNPDLQASFTELGIAEADLVQAGRMRNPTFSFLKLTPVAGEYDLESVILFDVMSLLTMPLKTAIEKNRFEQAKLQTAISILDTIAKTKKAYYAAISAKQMHTYLEKIKETAKISAQLAAGLAKVGNWSKLQQTREASFYAEITAKAKQAKITEIKEREKLIRLLGLLGQEIQFTLPEQLPDLPPVLQEFSQVEEMAIDNRLDIQAMKYELESKAKALGLTKATRFVNILDLGYAYNSSHTIAHQNGYQINVEIPIFDWGSAKVAKAKNIYMQSVWRFQELVIRACSEIRELYQIYEVTFEIAKHYSDEVVPLRKQILEEDMLRYNGMLISTFELMADEREQIISVNAYIESLRDFWLAQTDLQTALMVKSPFLS